MDQDKPVYPLPTEGELIAFPHGAAGHQGISSNAAGDIIIKPCTQAEIDFYEAAQSHPEFKAHMPVYMGALERGARAAVQAMPPATEQGIAMPDMIAQAEEGARVTTVAEEQPSPEQGKEQQQAKAWIPSGGKKLDTGLAVVLENAAASFKRPNVIDLKLGARLWADDCPEPKRQKLEQVAARTTSRSLGFRIAGAKIWLGSKAKDVDTEANTDIKDGYKSYNKHYGQSLDEQSVQKAIATFLSGTWNPTVFGRDKFLLASAEAGILTKRLIKELESIEYVLEHEESRMYSASILVVIEGDHKALQEAMDLEKKLLKEESARPTSTTVVAEDEEGEDVDEDDEADEDEDEEEPVVGPKVMEVRLIDFAHASFTPGQGPDENALMGVQNIIKILKEVSD